MIIEKLSIFSNRLKRLTFNIKFFFRCMKDNGNPFRGEAKSFFFHFRIVQSVVFVQQINSDNNQCRCFHSVHNCRHMINERKLLNFYSVLSFTTFDTLAVSVHIFQRVITVNRLQWNQFNGLLLFIVWRSLWVWNVSHLQSRSKHGMHISTFTKTQRSHNDKS